MTTTWAPSGALRTHNRPATEGLHVSLRADLGNGPDGKVDWEHAAFEHPEPFSWTQFCLEDLVRARAEGRCGSALPAVFPSLFEGVSSCKGCVRAVDRKTAGDVEAAHAVTEACLAVAVSHARGGAWVDLPMVGTDREMYVFHV